MSNNQDKTKKKTKTKTKKNKNKKNKKNKKIKTKNKTKNYHVTFGHFQEFEVLFFGCIYIFFGREIYRLPT